MINQWTWGLPIFIEIWHGTLNKMMIHSGQFRQRKLAGNFIFLVSPWIWGGHLPCLGSIDTFAAMPGKWCAASSAESEICFPAARGSQWITGSEMCFFIFFVFGAWSWQRCISLFSQWVGLEPHLFGNILQYIYLHLPHEFHEMDLKCRVFHTWLPCGTGPCRTTRLVPMLRLLVFFFRLGL